MKNYSKISKVLKNATVIVGDLMLLADLIKSHYNKSSDPKIITPNIKKTNKYYNRVHNYTQRKMRAAEQKAKDTSLRDYILSGNKEWATSKLKEKPPVRLEDDPFEGF